MTFLECSLCSRKYEPGRVHNLCECGGPLLARYDLAKLRSTWNREQIAQGPNNMWRYGPVLPPTRQTSIVSLGEGMTPLLRTERLGHRLGANQLWLKDEGLNPTGSFKARGLSCAVSMAVELGIKKLAIPSAGNAASAMAAYAAAAGIEAHIFMPRDVPQANFIECKAYGAHVTLVDGLISDCAKLVAAGAAREGWFDVTTLKEPYRIEGKKTMGYELAEQMDWRLPDVIVYPTGGGTGLIGMWKAFEELERIGWVKPQARPKMVTVQAENCAPIVRAFQQGTEKAQPWEGASTIADGLRVPRAIGDLLILRAIRESGGTALSVPDRTMVDGMLAIGKHEGISAAPEGGAALEAIRRLAAAGSIKPADTVVLFNTGGALKYLDVLNQQ